MLQPDNTVKQLKSSEHQVSAWIEVDGMKVNIFGQQTEGKVTSGFMESILGKEFALCYKLGMGIPPHDIGTSGLVDGSEFEGFVHNSKSSMFQSAADSPVRVHEMEGTHISSVQKIEFGELKFTENDSIALKDEKILNGLGTIQLELEYGKIGKVMAKPTFYHGPVNQAPVRRALEPDLDMDMRAVPGRIIDTDESDVVDWFPLSHRSRRGGASFAVFKFYFRSAEILWRNGLVPNPSMLSSKLKSPFLNKDSPQARLYAKFIDHLLDSSDDLVDASLFE